MAKKVPTIKIKLEGISGFTVRDVVVQAKADGTAEIPEWITGTAEFSNMVAELGLKGIKIQNLGELPDSTESPEPPVAAADEPSVSAEEAK